MGVNIFGGASKISQDKFYIDEKFKTLSANLALKVNKMGDILTGDLKLLLNGDEIRTFGVSDISSDKSVSLLLGDELNQIRHNYGHALKIGALHGLKITCPTGEVCRMGSQTDANIAVNNNFIKDLRDPIDDADAATKQYIDTRCVKNNVGHVPNLITNSNSKAGFIVTASSEVGLSFAYNVFSIIGEWISQEKTSFWIQLKCPEPVRIHKIALRGVRSGVIRNWLLQASNDNDDAYEILYDNYMDTGNTESCIDSSLIIVENDSIHKYSTYRIWVHNSDGDRPGLSHWQLYTVDSLV
jgi:hypothetical protein